MEGFESFRTIFRLVRCIFSGLMLLLVLYSASAQKSPSENSVILLDSAHVDQLIAKGKALVYMNRDSLAIYYKEADRISRLINYPRGIFAAGLLEALYYGTIGQNLQAYRSLLQVSQWLDAVDRKQAADYYYFMAYYLSDMGDNNGAVTYIEKSLQLSTFLHDSIMISKCKAQLGLMSIFEDKYDLAINYLLEADTFSQKHRESFYANIASSYSALGKHKKALDYALRSKRLLKAGDLRLATVYSIIGATYKKLLQYDSAVWYLTMSNQITGSTGDFVVSSYLDLSEISEKRGQMKAAEQYLLKARDLGIVRSKTRYLLDVYEALYKFYERHGNKNQSFNYVKKYAVLGDSLSEIQRLDAVRQVEDKMQVDAEYAARQQQFEIAALKKENELKEAATMRRVLIIGLLLAVAAGVYAFVSYRKKQRLNLLLEQQNREIELKNAELQESIEKLRQAQQQLVQSEKMASLGLLAAGVAHEIRNPLNYISGAVSALIGLRDDFHNLVKHGHPKQEQLLDDFDSINELIQTGVRRSTKIVSSLRHFSTPHDSVTSDTIVNLEEVIEESLTLLNFRFKESGIAIERSFLAHANVTGNSSLLVQVFVNIFNNSIDAVETLQGPRNIKVTIEPVPSFVRVSVWDNGTGISPEAREKIFTPFFTTKPQGKGTGLGLSIAFGIVKKHGGKLSFSSTEKGTCFFVELPTKG
jgi:signal transduction histidine kinase